MNTLTISLTLNFVFIARYAIQSYRNYVFEKKCKKFIDDMIKFNAECKKFKDEQEKEN